MDKMKLQNLKLRFDLTCYADNLKKMESTFLWKIIKK